ncbi:MAG TPA: site-2 protease family protein [Candidatus Polarisedimenticolia bacterium]|nr:site-2 protease family protein [Candidatus Polarisedimenticolia bacterium]
MTGLGNFLVAAVMLVPALLIAIPLHEMGHAAAAYLLGDRSVRYFGYFTWNPRRFIDPLGVIAVFIALVGWGKKVPVQPNRINTMGQKVLFELGGPAANLLAALVFGEMLRLLLNAGVHVPAIGSPLEIAAYLVKAIWFLNLSIFAFQLLPIPGLDGWDIVEALFRNRNPRFFFNVSTRRREIWIGAIVVIFIGSVFGVPVLNLVMSPFYTPASLISLGICTGYGVPGFNQLTPCLL